MKKTFPLHLPGRDDPRVIEAIKHDVRKYVKRERKKTLPEGFTAWEFDCRIGASPDAAEPVALDALATSIDTVAQTGAANVYIEILARAGYRPAKAPPSGLLSS
jgi:hypothetical protein